MNKTEPSCDVFISHSWRDASFATDIAHILQSYGLKVITNADVAASEQFENVLWDAIVESQAFVAVIPETEPSASTSFELGAAKAWNKPIYAVASNASTTRLPAPLTGMVIYSPSRVEEIALEIKRSSESLSDSEKSVLIDEFHRIGQPVDELMLQPKLLSKLTKQFQKRTKRQIAAEELVRLLLRLRKTGSLRITKRKRPKTA
jgi:hypothetical protein